MRAGEPRYRPHAQRVAAEALHFLATGAQTPPYSNCYAGFGLVDAYDVVAVLHRIRVARGRLRWGARSG